MRLKFSRIRVLTLMLEAERCLRAIVGQPNQGSLEQVFLVSSLVSNHHAVADHEKAFTGTLFHADVVIAFNAKIGAFLNFLLFKEKLSDSIHRHASLLWIPEADRGDRTGFKQIS